VSGDCGDSANAIDFDVQTAWMRRFQADAQSNLHAFAMRLHEAMPDRVMIRESKGLFARQGKTVGVTVAMDQNHYILEIVNGRLKASVAMVVRDIAINTKHVDPADWFAQLAAETQKASEHAKRLANSLSAFMAT
jgi:hypothetical protein